MELINEICISFLQGSGWLYNHDKAITISERNKAIDDFAELLKKKRDSRYMKVNCDDLEIMIMKEYLKAGGEYKSTEHINCSSDSSTNGWIPCSERLPEEKIDVLTFDIFGNMSVERLEEGEVFVDTVIAWIPLPEPYKPKGE